MFIYFFFLLQHQEKFFFPSLGYIFQIPYYGSLIFSLPTHLLVRIITTISILFILILTILSRLFYDIMKIVPVSLFLFVYETYFFSLISMFWELKFSYWNLFVESCFLLKCWSAPFRVNSFSARIPWFCSLSGNLFNMLYWIHST